jgi:hypothetical protein
MAITVPKPSEEAQRALEAGAALFTDDNLLARRLTQAPVGLRLLTLTLDEAGALRLGLQPAGWRFLASDGKGNVISGEVWATQNGQMKLNSVSRDPAAVAPLQVAEQIERLPDIQGRDFELNVLRIPGVLLEALLLKPKAGGDDLIVPVITPSPELRVSQVYGANDFLSSIQSLVARFRKLDDLERAGH